MPYEKDIFIVLNEAGETGLTVRKIARHVFNAHNSFFETASEKDIGRTVQRYLAYHNRPGDTIEKVRHGVYRLNLKSKTTKNLLSKYTADKDSAESQQTAVDQSLSLFW